MTKISIFRDGSGNIVKSELSGHTDFAEAGSDIVCSAVSSAVFMALNGIEKVLKMDFGYESGDGYLFFVLPDDLDDNKRRDINILLESMYLFLRELEEKYSGSITITELEV